MFLVNSRLGLVSATFNASPASGYTCPVPLIPKLRGYFAEFLHHDYLDRLGILYLSTSVGLGYGRLNNTYEAFLGSIGSPSHRPEVCSTSCLRHKSGGFAYHSPYTLIPGQPSPGMGYLPASLRSLPTMNLGRRVADITPKGSANFRA